jgi:hypothetical protein
MVAHYAQVLIIKIALSVINIIGDINIMMIQFRRIVDYAQIYAPHAPIIFLVIHAYITPILMP